MTDGAPQRRALFVLAGTVIASVLITLAAVRLFDGHEEGAAGDGHDEHAGEHSAEGEHPEGEGHEEGALPVGEHAAIELSDEQIAIAEIETAIAGPGPVVITVDLPGEIVLNAEAMAHVGPRVPGTVTEIKKKLGDEVKEGDVLATLDSRDVAEMQGEVLAARERKKLAEATYQRKKQLYDEKIASEKEFIEAQQAFAEANVALESAERALGAKTGGSSGGSGYSLVAPLSGTIVDWHIGLGEVLNEETRAYTIADLGTIWVHVTIYAKDLARVQKGQRALLRAEGIEAFLEGSITYVSPTVDELTRAATARIELHDPPEAWRPGLFVTAQVEVDEAKADVVVPEEAVQTIDGRPVVFVREDRRFEPRAVTTGRHGHDAEDRLVVEIVRGLQAGARVASKNSFILKAELGKAEATHAH